MTTHTWTCPDCDVAWCPGCGNHGILKLVGETLAELQLDPQQTVFLDRALPDSLAYYRFLGLAPGTALLGALAGARYATVFLLDLLPLASDYARTEDPAAQRRIHDLLGLVYQELGFPVVTVPALAPDARVDFILERASAGTPAERGVS